MLEMSDVDVFLFCIRNEVAFEWEKLSHQLTNKSCCHMPKLQKVEGKGMIVLLGSVVLWLDNPLCCQKTWV